MRIINLHGELKSPEFLDSAAHPHFLTITAPHIHTHQPLTRAITRRCR